MEVRNTENIFANAEWIFADNAGEDVCDRYFEYRVDFDGDPTVTTNLYISAHSQYAVYLNGHFVDCGQYDDYEDYQVYDTLDLTPYVKADKNELYIGHYVCGGNFSTRRKQIPGILFSVWGPEKVLAVSGSGCLSRGNRHFLENRECITIQLGYNFEYDASVPEAPYLPSVLAGKEKNLYPRPVKKLQIEPRKPAGLFAYGTFLEKEPSLPKAKRMQTAYLSDGREEGYVTCESVRAEGCKESTDPVIHWNIPETQKADGVYLVLDPEKEMAGLLEFTLEVPEKTEILIGFGEHLEDLRVRCADGKASYCFRYLATPGKNTFFYPYQRIGFRYLQFHIYSSKGSLQAGIREQKYPVKRYPQPLTDNLHQRIYEVGCNTLELCMHEHYEDCPWREQALYAMDSRIQILCGYYAFHEYEMPRASLSLLMQSLRPDGLLELCAPGRVVVDIPGFSAVFIREVLEYMEYSGDTGFGKEIFQGLKRIVEGFRERMLENGLVPLYWEKGYWNFYEWREGLNGRKKAQPGEVDCLLNAFVSDAFRCFERICRILEKQSLAEEYVQVHKELNRAIHEMFFDEKYGAYRSAMEDAEPIHTLTQGMMLYIDAVPVKWVDRVAAKIMEGSLIPCSLSMSVYVYEALLKYPEKYKSYVLSEIEKIWGQMIYQGADTFWETDLGASDEMGGSLCHGWSAVPVYIFGRYFASDLEKGGNSRT